MELLPRLSKRRLGGSVLLSTAVLGVAVGCGPNYSGKGNEFVVIGKVTDPGEHSLKARIFEVEDEHGDAKGWFDDHGIHQLHDNCNCSGFFARNKKYGIVVNLAGVEIGPNDVEVGACVEFTGKIRANKVGKIDKSRPVYDLAQEIHCDS